MASILMILGIGLFGSFTGYIASLFDEVEAEQDKETNKMILELSDEVAEMKLMIKELKAKDCS